MVRLAQRGAGRGPVGLLDGSVAMIEDVVYACGTVHVLVIPRQILAEICLIKIA